MNNNDLFQASRRRFLAQLGGLTVAGMLGPSLLTPRRATAAQAATEAVISKEGILTGSHWGAIRATVKDGRFVAAKTRGLDKKPSKRYRRIAGSCTQRGAYSLPDGTRGLAA